MADLTTGVYILTNIGSGSMMEVSLKYPKTVKGNAFSGNENQQVSNLVMIRYWFG